MGSCAPRELKIALEKEEEKEEEKVVGREAAAVCLFSLLAFGLLPDRQMFSKQILIM